LSLSFFLLMVKSLVRLLSLKINQYHQDQKKLSGFKKPSRLT
jgi:hypothetical protein